MHLVFRSVVPICLVLAAACGDGDPAGPGSSGFSPPEIAWSQEFWDPQGAPPRIVLFDGSNAEVVGPGSSLLWSPDGTRMVFFCSDQNAICTVDANGEDRQVVTTPGVELFDWSSSGRLLYGRNDLLYHADPDFSAEVSLSTPGFVRTARWSPDGSRIAFLAGTPIGAYTIASDGTDLVTLVEPEAGVPVPDISWSPDGQSLLVQIGEREDARVLRIQADGGGATPIYDGSTIHARFAPDGSRIAFHTGTVEDIRIAVIDADLTNLRFLTDGPAARAPVWSGDSNWIAFTKQEDTGDPRLWAMRSDGSDEIALRIDDGIELGYQWRP